jgi:putative oxidoreductase
MEINLNVTQTMKTSGKLFDITLLIVRIFLGTVIGMHGAQKLLGWFEGYGFEGTVGFFSQTIGLPYLFAVLIILAESIGMIALILGLFSRILSGSLIIIMLGAIFTMHSQHGFFMNWSGAQGGEGFEFHLLAIGTSLVILLHGAGAFSIDHFLLKRFQIKQSKRPSLV